MIGKDELAQAASDADALAEEHENLPDYWRSRGVDILGLTYVAEQRALRAVMIERGINPNHPRPYAVSLNAEQRRRQAMYAAIFMDGFAVRDRIAMDSQANPARQRELAAKIVSALARQPEFDDASEDPGAFAERVESAYAKRADDLLALAAELAELVQAS